MMPENSGDLLKFSPPIMFCIVFINFASSLDLIVESPRWYSWQHG